MNGACASKRPAQRSNETEEDAGNPAQHRDPFGPMRREMEQEDGKAGRFEDCSAAVIGDCIEVH
jgi:hypothetical protein